MRVFIKKSGIILLAWFYQSIEAQPVSRLLETIKNYDFYHTRVYAYKQLKKKKKISAAAYALAYVYYQKYQPFHHIDSADVYIHLSILNYPHKPYITKYGILDSVAIYSLYDSIVKGQFQKISNNTYPKIYDIFMSQHPFMSKSLKEKIKAHQHKKIIEYVEKTNKSDTTFYYITIYENHPEKEHLYQLLDNQIYNEMTQHQTSTEYLLFLRNYPNNRNREKALQALLDIYVYEKNITGLKSFIQEFGKDKYYVEQAWKWLFTYSVKKFSNEELEKFIETYPDFPFKKDILDEIEMNNQILIPMADTTENIGFIDTLGKFVIPPIYDAVTPFNENVSVVIKNDTSFFINKKHEKIIPYSYKDAYPFYNGYAPVYDGQYWYFINRLGVKQSDNFEWISELSTDKNYVFKKDNLYGLCDYKGQILLMPIFEKLGDFDNHYTYYVENNLYGIIWDNGKKYPAQYQWISTFQNDIAIVKYNNQYGLVTANNEILLNPEYDLIFYCNNNIYQVIKNKKYGFYDAKEKCFKYFIRYDYIKNMDARYLCNYSYFKLILQNKVFIADNNGNYLNKKPFQDAILTNDFILAKNKNKWAILSTTSNSSSIFNYESVAICNNNTLLAKQSDYYLIIDKQNNVLYKTKNELTHIHKNYYYEQINGETGQIIDINGKILLSEVESYRIFDKYIIGIKQDKTIKIIK